MLVILGEIKPELFSLPPLILMLLDVKLHMTPDL